LAEQAPDTGETRSDSQIVVIGTLEQSTAAKKDSTVVLDARSQQEIRSLPDVNAAEALQRLPGISMESDTGEGRFVNIRGMDADLNGTTYDGVRLTASNPASPQGGSRAVAFDAFPSGVLGGVEVVKSLSPDMDAEGLGGVVNIVPRSMPTDKSLFIEGGFGAGVETLHGTQRYMGDLTVGVGFGGRTEAGQQRFSLIVSYAYDQDARNIDDVEADYINDPTVAPAGTSPYLTSKLYDDLQPRQYAYHRTRQGVSANFTFRPDDNTTLYVRGLHSGYVEDAYKHEYKINGLADDIVSVDNATGEVITANAVPRMVAIATREELGNDMIEAGGHTKLDSGIKFDYRGAYSTAHDHFPYSLSASWDTANPVALSYNNTANPNVPTYHAVDGTNLTDPTIYTVFNGSNGPSHNNDREWSGVFDVSIPLGPEGSNGELKLGVSGRFRERTAQAYAADLVDPGTSYAAFSSVPDNIFYNGAYNIGPYPNFAKVQGLAQGPLEEDLTAYQDDSEDVYAGFAQYSATFGKLSLVGGLRVEATHATYRANIQDDSGTITPNSAKSDYTKVFPDVSLKYAVSDDLLLRAAFTTAIGRPGFNQITAAKSIDVANLVVTEGNPTLKPTVGHGIDLAAEFYTPKGGLLSLGLFYKAFDDYIISTVQRDVTDYPDPRLAGQSVEVDSFQNIGSAHVEGIELNVRQPFTFLPAPFNGFGVEGNLTLLESRGLVHQTDTAKTTLPQTSPTNANFALFYESGRVSARIAGSYVSRNLWAVGSAPATDLYSQPRFRLDLSGSFAITDNVKFFVEAKNLTNTKLEFTQTGDERYPVQREFYDTDVLAGFRVKFGR
jgi:TonB-dependent receptor